MPRDSGGTYSRPAGNPVVGNTPITATWGNTTLADIATALTASLDRDGKGGMLAPLLFTGITAAIKGGIADGASAVATILDNVGALANAGAKLLSIRNNGVEKAYFDKDGRLYVGGEIANDTVARLAVDASTTSASAVDVAGLAFAVEANASYEFRADLFASSGNAVAMHATFSGPAAPTRITFESAYVGSGGHPAAMSADASSAFGTTVYVTPGVAGLVVMATIRGYLINGANAGTVQLRFLSSSPGSTVTIGSASTLRWRKVG